MAVAYAITGSCRAPVGHVNTIGFVACIAGDGHRLPVVLNELASKNTLSSMSRYA